MQLSNGLVTDGKITGIKNFGIFVEIEKGISGLVHISEVSKTYIADINDIYSIGDTVKVKVLNCDDIKKISLSIKQADDSYKQTKEKQSDSYNVFDGVKSSQEPLSFEDMMTKFKQSSEEKFSQLKRKNSETRRPRRSSK